MTDQDAIDNELKMFDDMTLNKFHTHHGPFASDRIQVLNGGISLYGQEFIIEDDQVVWNSGEEMWHKMKTFERYSSGVEAATDYLETLKDDDSKDKIGIKVVIILIALMLLPLLWKALIGLGMLIHKGLEFYKEYWEIFN